MATSESGSTRHQQASEMFQGLESHSVLHVLHKSVNLACLQEKEVFELLRKRPVFTPLNTEKEKKENESLRSTDVVAQGEHLEKFSEELQDSKIHPEVQRDIYLYHSYCAIRNFMEAVTSTVDDNHIGNKEVDSEKSPVQSMNLSALNSESLCDHQPCHAQIKDKLEAGKSHLSQVHPLSYRVEIVEDIFSLLFGTNDDLYEGRTQQTESDDVETMDEETRSLSASNQTGSLESLASSVDLAADNIHGPLNSLPQTPDSSQKHKEAATITPSETVSRHQLFKNENTLSDSCSLKRLQTVVGDVETTLNVSPISAITRTSENDSCSGNFLSSKGSSLVALSDDNDLKCKFVIEDEIVPDMLNTLKECLMDLNSAKFTASKQGVSLFLYHTYVASPTVKVVVAFTSNIYFFMHTHSFFGLLLTFVSQLGKSESNLSQQDWLHTSVNQGTMEQRISRLGQYINEAQWRFQLVSWKKDVKSYKSKQLRKRSIGKLQEKTCLDELNWKAEVAQDEDSDDTLIEGRVGEESRFSCVCFVGVMFEQLFFCYIPCLVLFLSILL